MMAIVPAPLSAFSYSIETWFSQQNLLDCSHGFLSSELFLLATIFNFYKFWKIDLRSYSDWMKLSRHLLFLCHKIDDQCNEVCALYYVRSVMKYRLTRKNSKHWEIRIIKRENHFISKYEMFYHISSEIRFWIQISNIDM